VGDAIKRYDVEAVDRWGENVETTRLEREHGEFVDHFDHLAAVERVERERDAARALLETTRRKHADSGESSSCAVTDGYRTFYEQHLKDSSRRYFTTPGAYCTCGAAEWNAKLDAALEVQP